MVLLHGPHSYCLRRPAAAAKCPVLQTGTDCGRSARMNARSPRFLFGRRRKSGRTRQKAHERHGLFPHLRRAHGPERHHAPLSGPGKMAYLPLDRTTCQDGIMAEIPAKTHVRRFFPAGKTPLSPAAFRPYKALLPAGRAPFAARETSGKAARSYREKPWGIARLAGKRRVFQGCALPCAPAGRCHTVPAVSYFCRRLRA